MNTYKCNWCGRIQKSIDNISGDDCDICNKGVFEIIEHKLSIEQEKNLNNYIIESIKGNIQKMGNNKCWDVIERFSKVKTRVSYRKYFFLAGGIVPETEIKERI